jgi:outer membrane protein insertion porin family
MGETSHPLKPPLHSTLSPRDKEPDDLAKLKKWQEERIARKLRGEYESAVFYLSEIVSDFQFLLWYANACLKINSNLSSNMNISAVRVEGSTVTRSSFLGFLINPLLASSTLKDSPSNLESVLHTTRKISHILHKTDMFKSVDAKIERARDSLANPDDVDIIFNTREKGRYYLNTSTELGNNEGTAVCCFAYIFLSVRLKHISYNTDCNRSHPQRFWRRRNFRG